MAIINGTRFSKKTRLKLDISAELHEQVQSYCKWAGIEDSAFFFEEAAYYILAKDKEWKNQNKTRRKSRKAAVTATAE